VPGHRRPAAEHRVTYTTVPGQPAPDHDEKAKPEGGE